MKKMEMRCELGERGQLTIDLLHMIHEGLTGEQQMELVESLSAGEYMIESVCAQIIDGYTPRYSYWGAWSTAYDAPLQRARALIANSMDNPTKRHVEDLERRVTHAEAEAKKYRDDYFKLYHAQNLERV